MASNQVVGGMKRNACYRQSYAQFKIRPILRQDKSNFIILYNQMIYPSFHDVFKKMQMPFCDHAPCEFFVNPLQC